MLSSACDGQVRKLLASQYILIFYTIYYIRIYIYVYIYMYIYIYYEYTSLSARDSFLSTTVPCMVADTSTKVQCGNLSLIAGISPCLYPKIHRLCLCNGLLVCSC